MLKLNFTFHFQARQKIIEINTSSWQPKLSKEFTLQLADKCVGYCGADIKALCTEAALFALRRRYPQIYKTSKKLALNTNEIKISSVDFKNALKSITPASNRSNISLGVSLPEHLKPLLSAYVEKATDIVMKIFPAGKKITGMFYILRCVMMPLTTLFCFLDVILEREKKEVKKCFIYLTLSELDLRFESRFTV